MLKTLTFDFAGVKFPFKIDSSETIISNTVEQTGVWEHNQLSLYDGLLSDNGVFLDIGANVGVNSIFAYFLKPDARIIAIEASPKNYEILKDNVADTTIEARNIAVADRDGVIEFHGEGTNAKIGSGASSYQVQANTLDSVAESIDKIDLLKIDVEGFTDLVLADASRTLSKTKNAIIEFSILDVQDRFGKNVNLEECFSEIWSKMNAFEHTYYISRNDGLIRINAVSDLIEILPIEHDVGDVLFSREVRHSISPVGLMFRKVRELLIQNHYRILEIQELRSKAESIFTRAFWLR